MSAAELAQAQRVAAGQSASASVGQGLTTRNQVRPRRLQTEAQAQCVAAGQSASASVGQGLTTRNQVRPRRLQTER
jgi:hypothetical protein